MGIPGIGTRLIAYIWPLGPIAMTGAAIPMAGGIIPGMPGAMCMAPATGEVKQVFRLADDLLYKAKESGRNRHEAN